jgi:hypothetical protein
MFATCTEFRIAIFIIFIFGIFFEYLTSHSKRDSYLESNNQYFETNDMSFEEGTLTLSEKIRITLLHTLIIICSQVKMFLLMTFNFWIILAVIVGNAFGYFIFHSGRVKHSHIGNLYNVGYNQVISLSVISKARNQEI